MKGTTKYDLKLGEPVEVVWGDAWSADGMYYNPDEDLSPIIVNSVGFFCEENDETFVIADSKSESGRLRNVFSIPRTWVKEVYRHG